MPRTMFVGDNTPEMKFQASDETGVLDLSTGYTSMVALFEGSSSFSGPATAINPAEDDADGIHHWNAGYPFASGDTADVGVYNTYLRVVNNAGGTLTFGGETLTIKAVD